MPGSADAKPARAVAADQQLLALKLQSADENAEDGEGHSPIVFDVEDNEAGQSGQSIEIIAEFTTAPDGGYGWVVVVAAFCVNLLCDGITFSFGLLMAELLSVLGESREGVAWIVAFLSGIPLLVGPLTSVLIDRFGCRKVTIVGGLLAGTGFSLVFVMPPSLLLVVVFAGLLGGLGLGLCFMPAVTVVSYYFLKRRALATGISVSGSGIGTVVFSYAIGASLNRYGWQGTFLLVGGLLFNLCVCGALYRRLESKERRILLCKHKRLQTDAMRESHHDLPSAAAAAAAAAMPARHRIRILDRRRFFMLSSDSTTCCIHCHTAALGANANANNSDCREHPAAQVRASWLAKLAYLFRRPVYPLFLASNCLLYFWYTITYCFLPDHVVGHLGLSSDQAELLIALIGVANAIGQIVLGLFGDLPQVDPALLYVVCMSLAGLANCLVPLCTTLPALVVYVISFGFLVSANYSLCSIVLIDYFGLDKFTTGYGIMMFAQGLASLIGPPVVGRIRDSDATYNRAFLLSGLFMVASNLLSLPAIRRIHDAAGWCPSSSGSGEGSPGSAETPPAGEPSGPQQSVTAAATP